ncbi:MAG: phosphatidate cytidylyltransferase [Deltaproteobacteria bacterium]|nr:phosphatidate cytidylyltransferase [Deltaproteobacteria bacterium]
MLLTRIFTALLLIAVIATTLVVGSAALFRGLVLLAVLFALAEFYRLTLGASRVYRLTATLLGLGLAACQSWHLPWERWLWAMALVLAVVLLWRATTLERFAARWGVALLGSIYIGSTLPYLSWLRALDHGRALVAMTLAMVALSDSAAFAVGRTLGRRKLAPLTSPNKTLEGFIAGFAGSIVGMLGCRALWWPEFPLLAAVQLGLVIGLVAPIGDLIESAVKRGAHVKDSGQMLPGHGGMLDRCDAYLFSAPIVYYFVTWLGISH